MRFWNQCCKNTDNETAKSEIQRTDLESKKNQMENEKRIQYETIRDELDVHGCSSY
jgi:hypothetical protein